MNKTNAFLIILLAVTGAYATTELRNTDILGGVKIQGLKTNAEITALVCANGKGGCWAASSDEGDLYISTGTLAGQYRNARTGKGP